MKATELAKQHGPAAGVAAAVAVAVTVGLAPSAPPPVVLVEPKPIAVSAATQPPPSIPPVPVSLLSCGDQRGDAGARAIGDSKSATVRLGPGAAGRCTIVFDRPWSMPYACNVSSGTIAATTPTDLVLERVDGDLVAYSCGAKESK